MKYIIALSTLLAVTLPVGVYAETVLRSGNDVSVDADQLVAGDYYVSVGPFGTTVMSGSVAQDMYALGASVTVNGEVGTDVSILAGTAQIHAPVGDDVRIVGGEVTIADSVGGDVFIFGGEVRILSTATVAGDVFVFGGSVTIEGEVAGSVYGKMEYLTIGGLVAKDVVVTAAAGMVLTEDARVSGNIRYTSLTELSRSPQAIVEGEITKQQTEPISQKELYRQILTPIFVMLFTTLVLYMVSRRFTVSVISMLERHSGKSIALGLAVLFFGPFVSVLLMITVLGFWLGLAVFALLFALYLLSFAYAAMISGVFLLRVFRKDATVSLSTVIVGTLLLLSILAIPVLGALLVIALCSATLGAMLLQLHKKLVS